MRVFIQNSAIKFNSFFFILWMCFHILYIQNSESVYVIELRMFKIQLNSFLICSYCFSISSSVIIFKNISLAKVIFRSILRMIFYRIVVNYQKRIRICGLLILRCFLVILQINFLHSFIKRLKPCWLHLHNKPSIGDCTVIIPGSEIFKKQRPVFQDLN